MYNKWMSITAAILMMLLAVSSAADNSTRQRARPQGACSKKVDCPSHMCCSKWGYCGVGAQFCGANKLEEPTKPTDNDTEISDDEEPDTVKLRAVRAAPSGPQGACSTKTDCPSHMCCSKWGYCGVGAQFCGANQLDEPTIPEEPTNDDDLPEIDGTAEPAKRAASAIDAFRAAELSRTNVYRRRHCVPPAQLSATLNNVAQAYAEKLKKNNNCQMIHSGGRYGENLYWMSGGSVKGGSATDLWYSSEVNKYNYNNPVFSPATGHFTQLVWKTSTNVGFGVAQCANGATIVVANYEAQGNVQGQFRQNVLQAQC